MTGVPGADGPQGRRERLLADIAQEEQRLASLRTEAEESTRRLAAMRAELSAATTEQPRLPLQVGADPQHVPTTNAEKVALFRSLFRGREEVFPRRWENARTGKSGYSPACANEWQRGVCEKSSLRGRRRLSCGECPSQAFVPVTDDETGKHLKGTQVMGVYPMLRDETCWFLAADFDGESWPEDVGAFVAACETQGVPTAIERSRSGNGAHAWFFFTAPVSATVVRKMGCFLITEAMSRRHQLPMKSYDRLFPNQDTMPKGGFGNLIALPLQREARERGNSVFVDAEFRPYADQWGFMAGIQRLDPAFVQALADEATRRGQVTGVRASFVDEDDHAPWTRTPSGKPRKRVISEPLPAKVRAVICQRIFVEKAGLPSVLLNQIRRLAAFQNPEFYKKQSMRLSTALTPRIISCAEECTDHVSLPRGCLSELEDLLRAYGSALEMEDKRTEGESAAFAFQGRLTAIQQQAVRTLLGHDMGVFVAPPGVGKTVVGTYLAAARQRNTLVLVHRKPLLDQWLAQLALFLGLERRDIGQIGAGKRRPNGKLDVAMIQSLVRKGQVDDIIANYGHVLIDECHHVPAVSFERVLSEAKARYITGLTATPQRRDGHHPILSMQIGPVLFAVPAGEQAVRRPFVHRLIVRETGFQPTALPEGAAIQELYAALAADGNRNDLIIGDVLKALEEGHSPILLTERRDHLEHFAERLSGKVRHLITLHGGMTAKERREVLARVAAVPRNEVRLLLATGRYIGEGFDDARLDTLFLALPVSWKGTLVQYTGRLHRLYEGKTKVRIYDYVDSSVLTLLRMFRKRLRGYRAIGYTPDDEHPCLNLAEDDAVSGGADDVVATAESNLDKDKFQ